MESYFRYINWGQSGHKRLNDRLLAFYRQRSTRNCFLRYVHQGASLYSGTAERHRAKKGRIQMCGEEVGKNELVKHSHLISRKI